MKNDAIKAIVVLTLISLIIMSLLSGINLLTKDRIAQNEYEKMMKSLDGLIPEVVREDYEQITDLAGYPKSIQNVFVDKNGRGVAIIFAVKSQYSSGDMKYSVGFDNEGKIISVKQLSYMESKSFGKYYEGFVGLLQDDAAGVEVFGGVTYSSNAFKSGLNDAFIALGLVKSK
jgi:Na+-translocating ferredoxin:NAD+ oxidoreductase RnfG subunit